MDKYETLVQYAKDNEMFALQFYEVIGQFEIAWESGQFNEEPKGECCNG